MAHTETEAKLTGPMTALRNAFAAVEGGEIRQIQMEAIYYDTAEELLCRNGLALRLRLENGRGVVTCKTKGRDRGDGVAVRGEYEAPAETVEAGVSALCPLLAPDAGEILQNALPGLVPVAKVQCTRREKTVTVGDATFVVSLDEGTFNNRTPFGEVEAELVAGEPEAVNALARELCHRFGLQPEPRSKLERALADYREKTV